MIESFKNQKVKDLLKLREGKNRRKSGLILLEGDREIQRALANDFDLIELFACTSKLSDLSREILESQSRDVRYVSEQVFEKIALRETVGGLLATAKPKYFSLSDLNMDRTGFYLLAERVEKPGNLGAILRTADGVGADAVILLDQVTDVFNPNAIRSSLGAVFSVPTVSVTANEFIDFAKGHDIQLVSASPFSDKVYTEVDYTQATALVFGSEAFGLSDIWKVEGESVKIPMLGICDSLNVSVSAAILAYEVLRQRSAN